MEILKVETSLLLNDTLALMQDSSLSTAQAPMAPADTVSRATSSQPESKSGEDACCMPVPSTTTTNTDSHTGLSSGMGNPPTDAANSQADQGSLDDTELSPGSAEPSSSQTPVETSNRASAARGGEGSSNSQSSGDRADVATHQAEASSSGREQSESSNALVAARVAGVLPAVLSLLEGCLEALASNAQDAEALADGQQPSCVPMLEDRSVSRLPLLHCSKTHLCFMQ